MSEQAIQIIEAWCQKRGQTLAQYLEQMAAAYYLLTQIPPDEAVLVHKITHEDGGIQDVYYYRRREDKDR